jgi:UDP-glucose 4-epimerase
MTDLVIGGAGFVGATLVRRLQEQGRAVVVIDNLVRGRKEFLPGGVEFEFLDASDAVALTDVTRRWHERSAIAMVWHLAANSDIPAGIKDPAVDLKDTFLTTHALLVAMRDIGIRRLAFASSSAVYGEHSVPLHEDFGPLRPISNYGAMKLASEGAISAAIGPVLDQALIYRFPNVVGVPATHGVIVDFIRKLRLGPGQLSVLGDGSQQKPYLHVSELVDAMLFAADRSTSPWGCFNVGPEDDGVTVRFIAEETVRQVSPGARILYGTGDRGWVGDVPRFQYDTRRLGDLGWRPKLLSADAVKRAISEIAAEATL